MLILGYPLLLIVLLSLPPILSQAESSGFHLPLYRRGGRFAHHAPANITRLNEILEEVEGRYARTYSDVEGNRIVRRWLDGPSSAEDYMLDVVGGTGSWYTLIQVGEPQQSLEVDIDMLSPDFYTIMTSSGKGSQYDTFLSSTHKHSDSLAHHLCRTPSDIFHLPTLSSPTKTPIELLFPICQPPKYSHHTLNHAGTVLGLSPRTPTNSLSRLDHSTTSSLLSQLLSHSHIRHPLFSLTLLDSSSGLLSIGTTAAPSIESLKLRTSLSLKYLSTLHLPSARADMEAELAAALAFAIPPGSTHDDHFRWTNVGAGAVAGWHMTLMGGVWVNGVKVLRNQPVLLDVNCPVILAPAAAAAMVYAAIPGGRSVASLLESDDSSGSDSGGGGGGDAQRRFYAWPCLNEVMVEFEIAGWRFPVARGEGTRWDDVHGPVGGRFSLGQVDLRSGKMTRATGDEEEEGEEQVGTGYCVGIIVETNMGVKKRWARAGLRDTWVLGEPFFRGLGVTFDMGDEKGKGQRMGVRVY